MCRSGLWTGKDVQVKFEGEDVDAALITLRQYKGEWPVDRPLLVDEEVKMTLVVEVAEVSHRVNQRDGNLYRVHVLHVLQVQDVT
jgi:hypothetical protein